MLIKYELKFKKNKNNAITITFRVQMIESAFIHNE